jgi:hypothetical protein
MPGAKHKRRRCADCGRLLAYRSQYPWCPTHLREHTPGCECHAPTGARHAARVEAYRLLAEKGVPLFNGPRGKDRYG